MPPPTQAPELADRALPRLRLQATTSTRQPHLQLYRRILRIQYFLYPHCISNLTSISINRKTIDRELSLVSMRIDLVIPVTGDDWLTRRSRLTCQWLRFSHSGGAGAGATGWVTNLRSKIWSDSGSLLLWIYKSFCYKSVQKGTLMVISSWLNKQVAN